MTSKATRAEFDARLAEVGGSLTTFVVLRVAEEAPGGVELSQRELADRMGVEGPTMVRHLDRLEREGMIQRRRDPSDRRVMRIAVTTAGEEVLRTLEAVADAMDAEIAAMLGPEAYEAMLGMLEHLRAHMTQLATERKANAHAAV